MIEKNHILKKQNGSALVVTIMITSVMLILAVILLQRIIPYSRQIRSMQDSMQAYYTARSQSEIGKYEFAPTPTKQYRENIDKGAPLPGGGIGKRINIGATAKTLDLAMPDLQTSGATKKVGDVVIVSKNTTVPLQIKLYQNDQTIHAFGTSKKDPTKHILSSIGGGVTFDVGGIQMIDVNKFEPKLESDTDTAINIEFTSSYPAFPSYFGGGVVTTHTSLDIFSQPGNNGPTATIQFEFDKLLPKFDCDKYYCYLNFKLPPDATRNSIDFSLSDADKEIPDLNAILVADGMSENGLYHSRIIELIPVTQSI